MRSWALKYNLPVRWSWWVKQQPLRVFQPRFQPFQLSWTIALPCFSPQQRNWTDPKNEQRPTSSLCWNSKLFANVSLSLHGEKVDRENDKSSSWNKEESSKYQEKAGRSGEVIKSQIVGRVAVDRLQNGEISLVANKMRSPTPKWRDEWALWAMTAPHSDSANHSLRSKRGRGMGKGLNNRL